MIIDSHAHIDFFENPDETMRNFLINHPEFLENALNSDIIAIFVH